MISDSFLGLLQSGTVAGAAGRLVEPSRGAVPHRPWLGRRGCILELSMRKGGVVQGVGTSHTSPLVANPSLQGLSMGSWVGSGSALSSQLSNPQFKRPQIQKNWKGRIRHHQVVDSLPQQGRQTGRMGTDRRMLL